MTREEQIEQAAKKYVKDIVTPLPASLMTAFMQGAEWADEHPNNPYKDVIAHISSNTYKVWKQNLWHDAQGENLPPIDREVIVLCDDGKVCFGHRPIINGYVTVDGENLYPKTYDKGGWNIPNVRWWLDVELPNQ